MESCPGASPQTQSLASTYSFEIQNRHLRMLGGREGIETYFKNGSRITGRRRLQVFVTCRVLASQLPRTLGIQLQPMNSDHKPMLFYPPADAPQNCETAPFRALPKISKYLCSLPTLKCLRGAFKNPAFPGNITAR